jgi:hypothetical protein
MQNGHLVFVSARDFSCADPGLDGHDRGMMELLDNNELANLFIIIVM